MKHSESVQLQSVNEIGSKGIILHRSLGLQYDSQNTKSFSFPNPEIAIQSKERKKGKRIKNIEDILKILGFFEIPWRKIRNEFHNLSNP